MAIKNMNASVFYILNASCARIDFVQARARADQSINMFLQRCYARGE